MHLMKLMNVQNEQSWNIDKVKVQIYVLLEAFYWKPISTRDKK